MGLSDYLDRAPTGAQGNELFQQGAQSWARMPMAEEQLRAQRQANADAEYTAPGAAASQSGNQIAEFIKAHMRATPGYQPGFEDRLTQELQGAPSLGGPGQGPAQGQGPVAGPQAPVVNMGQQSPVSYAPPGSEGLSPGMPQVSVSRAPMSMDGTPMRQPLPAIHEAAMQRAAASIPPTQVQTQGPAMTNQDVNRYMHMAPFLKMDQPQKYDPRMDIADKKLAFQREALAQRKVLANEANALKERLAQLMARVRLKIGADERKYILQEMRIIADKGIANVRARSQQTSGIGGVVNDQATAAAMAAEDQAIAADEKEFTDLQAKLGGGGGGSFEVDVSRRGPQGGPPPAGARVNLVGPNGETGSVPAGKELDAWLASPQGKGWSKQ